jgi:hypothetical protein
MIPVDQAKWKKHPYLKTIWRRSFSQEYKGEKISTPLFFR